MTIKDLQN